MPIDNQKMTLTLKINNNQHFKCVLLDSDSNLGWVKFETSVFFILERSDKDFCFVLCGYETKLSTNRSPGKCMNVNKN